MQKDYSKLITLQVSNNLSFERKNEFVSVDFKSLLEKYPDFNIRSFVAVDGENELPSQFVEVNNSRKFIGFVCDFEAGQTKEIKIFYNPDGVVSRKYPKRTQAEISRKTGGKFVNREYIGGVFENTDFLKVPAEHTDHSWYIRYEGPGWESEKVGYRFYLDWRNAVDIFGKKKPDMVLQNVGQDGFDSYHEMSDWGMDILKVGGSLGLGSIGTWSAGKALRVEETDSLQCRIIASGPITSVIKTDYFGWQINGNSVDLSSYLTINSHSRLTRCDLILSYEISNLCTGIVKHDSAIVINKPTDKNEWKYFATYGSQSLNNDNLGMAVIFRNADFITFGEDPESHVVVLMPHQKRLSYYFLAAWELEPEGISNKAQFVDYLNSTLNELNNPVSVIVI